MPEWTAEVIWWVCGAGVVGVLLGWLIGRFGGGRVPYHEYDRLVTQERSIRKELNEAKAEQQKSTSELGTLRESNATLSGELDATQRLLTDARAETEQAKSLASDELAGINASLHDELEAARIRYAELHGSQTKMTDDLATAETRIAELDGETTRLGADLAASADRIAELDDIQSRMNDQFEAAAARVSEFEARTSGASDELYLARARVSEVEGKLAAALTALRSASDDLGAVHDGLNGVERQTTEASTAENGSIDLTEADSIDLRNGTATVEMAAAAADAAADEIAASEPSDT